MLYVSSSSRRSVCNLSQFSLGFFVLHFLGIIYGLKFKIVGMHPRNSSLKKITSINTYSDTFKKPKRNGKICARKCVFVIKKNVCFKIDRWYSPTINIARIKCGLRFFLSIYVFISGKKPVQSNPMKNMNCLNI